MEISGEPEWRSGNGEGEEKRKEADLDKEVWRCLNSVHEMLCHRQSLNLTLRKGWMELASARYQMGPARISQSLFSLKPQSAKALVDVSLHTEGEGEEELSDRGHLQFELIKDASERRQKVASYSDEYSQKYRKNNASSQLRRRPVSTVQVESRDSEKDELLQYASLVEDSDSEDDRQNLEVQKSTMQGFGTIVPPHLRNAQGSFVKALQDIVALLNAQGSATDAHCTATRLQASIESSDDYQSTGSGQDK